MLSQTSEYALRAVACLAAEAGLPRTVQEIAGVIRVPPGYLAKVLQQLAKAGLVSSQRGPKGGFSIARPPDEISVLDVLDAVDPIRRIERCPLGLPEHRTSLCRLHRKLDEAYAAIEDSFRAARVSDLVAGRGRGAAPGWPLPAAHTAHEAAPARRSPPRAGRKRTR